MAGYPHVTHPSAAKLISLPAEALRLNNSARLACVKHAASVHPEPGSNSFIKSFSFVSLNLTCSFFKLPFLLLRITNLVMNRSSNLELTMGLV